MALFSDIDWMILLVAAGFLLLGKDSAQTLRTIGRWYGRAGRLKQDLLSEFRRAAELPTSVAGPLSIRGALLGLDPPATRASGIPVTVTARSVAEARPIAPTWEPWTGGFAAPTWSTTVPAVPTDSERLR
ncbi:MAG: hypothetical protein WBE40_01840 [Thermoplasmata archaeon]